MPYTYFRTKLVLAEKSKAEIKESIKTAMKKKRIARSRGLGDVLHDQPWSDGNVGMIGISYFAGTEMLPWNGLRTLEPSCPSQAPSISMSRRPITAW